MRRNLAALLLAVGFLALLSYRYDFNAISILEKRWFHRQKSQSKIQLSLDGAVLTLPDSQEHRLLRIKKVCQREMNQLYKQHHRGQKSNFFPDTFRPRHCSITECPLLVDLKHHFLFCSIEKVASTSAKALFLPESNFTAHNVTALHKIAAEKLLRVGPFFYSVQKLRKFYKAMFVRHPFDRLVSTYEDKVGREPPESPYFYEKYFNEFMKKKNITSETMSFVEFVDYLIETPPSEYDEHWMPYFKRCEVCHVEYDFVGKLETSDDDFEALLSNGLSELKPKLKRLNTRDGRRGFVEEFFIQLERNQIMALYRIYRFDFELFGYNILNFIDTFDNVLV